MKDDPTEVQLIYDEFKFEQRKAYLENVETYKTA
jgi:hypothetical protein